MHEFENIIATALTRAATKNNKEELTDGPQWQTLWNKLGVSGCTTHRPPTVPIAKEIAVTLFTMTEERLADAPTHVKVHILEGLHCLVPFVEKSNYSATTIFSQLESTLLPGRKVHASGY